MLVVCYFRWFYTSFLCGLPLNAIWFMSIVEKGSKSHIFPLAFLWKIIIKSRLPICSVYLCCFFFVRETLLDSIIFRSSHRLYIDNWILIDFCICLVCYRIDWFCCSFELYRITAFPLIVCDEIIYSFIESILFVSIVCCLSLLRRLLDLICFNSRVYCFFVY